LAAAVVTLGAAAVSWVESKNLVEAAKIEAGITTA